jgi:hypothetical protein
MTSDPLAPAAEAGSPDRDRAGPDASAHLPEWLVHLIALVIYCMLQHAYERALAGRPRRCARLSSWCHDLPDRPAPSAQALAAAKRRAFVNAIARMFRRNGIGPAHPDLPEQSRAQVRFGGSPKGARPGRPTRERQWWDNLGIVPGMTGKTVATPAATAVASLLSPQAAAAPSPAPKAVPAAARHAPLPASWLSEYWPTDSWRLHSTGPPTGSPAIAGL